MKLCIVCEKEVLEHPSFKNVYYCNNNRCTRLGLLTVFVLIPKEEESKPEEQKND